MASTSLKERIDKERGKRKASEVHELILDNAHASTLDVLTDDYENLELLSLVGCTLTSLKGLAKLSKLRRLELSDNKLEDSLDLLAESCPALTHVNLSGNKIAKLDALKPLAGLKHLTHLDLFNCPVTEEADYRNKVFELLPGIYYLDGTNRDGEDEPDDSEDDVNEEEGDEDDDYDDEDDDDAVGLKALADGDLEDDEVEFEPGNEEEEEEEDEEDEEEDKDAKRGTKRKHRDEEEEEEEDDDDEDDE